MNSPEPRNPQSRFWRKYFRLTRAGVPVLRALAVIAEEERDPSFKDTILALLQDIEGGARLSNATGKHPATFSNSVCELIRTAERRGAWDEVLEELCAGLEDGTFS